MMRATFTAASLLISTLVNVSAKDENKRRTNFWRDTRCRVPLIFGRSEPDWHLQRVTLQNLNNALRDRVPPSTARRLIDGFLLGFYCCFVRSFAFLHVTAGEEPIVVLVPALGKKEFVSL